MLALTIDLIREFGFGPSDFVLRLSDRRAWMQFLEKRGVSAGQAPSVLQVVDKIEREAPEALDAKLALFGLTVADIREFIKSGSPESFEAVLADLRARGLGDYVEIDLSIVRGLAYYTGVVFEVFDRSKAMRALAGGGRYDTLIAGLSDGAVDLPALGFGMGDVVLGNFIDETPHAAEKLRAALAADPACDAYVIIADEARRAEALGLVQAVREAGVNVDYPLAAAKVGKQFQSAEYLGARYAVLVGAEWPEIKVKTLATRQEETLPHTELANWLKTREKNGSESRPDGRGT